MAHQGPPWCGVRRKAFPLHHLRTPRQLYPHGSYRDVAGAAHTAWWHAASQSRRQDLEQMWMANPALPVTQPMASAKSLHHTLRRRDNAYLPHLMRLHLCLYSALHA